MGTGGGGPWTRRGRGTPDNCRSTRTRTAAGTLSKMAAGTTTPRRSALCSLAKSRAGPKSAGRPPAPIAALAACLSSCCTCRADAGVGIGRGIHRGQAAPVRCTRRSRRTLARPTRAGKRPPPSASARAPMPQSHRPAAAARARGRAPVAAAAGAAAAAARRPCRPHRTRAAARDRGGPQTPPPPRGSEQQRRAICRCPGASS